MPQYLSDRDYQDYGGDLVQFSKKAALEAIAPQIDYLSQQNHDLQVKLAREARARMDMTVERAIPNFRDIDRDPRWHRYLLEVDTLSGRIRQVLLDDAILSGDANRVVQFFRAFQRSVGAADYAPSAAYATPAAHGRARSMPSGQVYTRDQIAKLYSAHRRGAYAGQEAAWQAQERDIIAAGRDGRILGGTDVHGK